MAIWNRKKDEEEEKLPKPEQPKQEEKTPEPAPAPTPAPQAEDAAKAAEIPAASAAPHRGIPKLNADQRHIIGQNHALRNVDFEIEKHSELENLPAALEPRREEYLQKEREGKLTGSATRNWGSRQISVDVRSIRDEQELAYFASTLETDKDKVTVMKAWADEHGLSANDVIFHGEELLGNRLFKEPQTAQGMLNAIGLVDVNGEKLDLRSADFASVVHAAQGIPDKETRKQAFEYIEKMTKTYGSRFVGMNLDGVSKDFRNSLDFPQKEYDDFVDRLESQFYAADGHEEENLRRYMAQYDAINGATSTLSAAQKHWYTKALDAAFVQQMGYGSTAPDAQKAREVLDQLDAARSAQETPNEPDVESVAEDKPGLIAGAWQALVGFVSDLLPKGKKDAEGAEAAPAPQPEATPAPTETMRTMGRAEDLPVTLVASASPAPPVTSGRAAFYKGEEAEQQTPEVQGPAYQPKAMDPATALEYAHSGRADQLDAATQEMLSGLYASASPGTQALLNVVTPEFYREYQTGNVPADFQWMETMGSQLGSSIMKYVRRISREDFPHELYGDAVMAIKEIIEAADADATITQDELAAMGRYESYIQKNKDALAPIEKVFEELEGMRQDAEADNAAIQADKDAELARDRQAVALGQGSAIQYQNVLNHAPEMDSMMAMRDPTYAAMFDNLATEFFSAAGNWDRENPAWMDTYVFKTMKANGVQDLEGEESAYEMLIHGTMESLLLQDMRVASALDMSLEAYYAKQGGMDLDMLADRASAQIVAAGSKTSEQELSEFTETVSREAEGLGAGQTLVLTGKTGMETVRQGRLESFIMVAAATDIQRDTARVATDFNHRYGAMWGRTAYRKQMYAYANSGKLPEALSKEIIGYLDEGGDPYQLGIHPGDNAWAVDEYDKATRNIETYQKIIASQATEGEKKFFETGTSVVSNARMMGEVAGLSLALTPILGPVGSFVAIRTVYGSVNQGRSMGEFMKDGYSLRESLMLSEMEASGEALANVTTLGHLTEHLKGYGALLNKGLMTLGGVKNPAVVNGFVRGVGTFFKTAAGEIAEETIKDPLLEGTFSSALVGAGKSVIEDARDGDLNPATALKHIVAGVDAAVGSVPETVSTMIDEAPQTMLATLPFALLGAGGEVVRNSASAKAARTYIENPSEENAKAFTGAVMKDAQDGRWIENVMSEMREAEVAEETAANLVFAPDPALFEKAQKTGEQADSHKKQMEASQTRIDEGWAAYDEGEASGNVDEQLAALEIVAKGKQGLEEHTREYEQKSLEAKEAERELVQEARGRAEATVSDRRARQKVQDTEAEQDRQMADTEQRESGNVDTMDADAFIEANYPEATDEEKQALRERYMARAQAKRDAQADGQTRMTVGDGIDALRNTVQIAKRLEQRYGTNIRFVKSLDGAEALYDGKTIYVGMDATQGDVIKRVLVHELTHSTEDTALYKSMRDALLNLKYGGDAQKLQADIQAKIRRYDAHYKKVGRTDKFTADDALKEIVADYNGELLSGNEETIRQFVEGEPTLARKIYNGIKRFVQKLRGVNDPEFEQIRKVEKLFETALKAQQEQRVKARDEQYSIREVQPIAGSDDTESVANDTENAVVGTMPDGSAVRYSLKSWTEDEKIAARAALTKAGHKAADVERWIDQTDSVAAMIAADKDRLDFEAADNQVMLKDNAEYVKTLDASTLCAKRLLYQGTFDAIQHALPDHVFTSEELLDLLNLMKDEGYETPCGVCYVESRRRHLGKYASEWLEGYDAKGGYQPKLDDVTTTDGLERMRHEHPEVYKSFVDAMNSKGSNNPKVVQLRTDYRGDIRRLTKSQVEKVTKIGGLRVQSFSDFETPHLLDMMQATLDMAGKGLTSQAYTKVPNFAWVFGDTGIKINLSLMAEGSGVDENGNLVFSSTEGMPIDEAMALRARYSENVGTIIVGANDDHIKAAMADPRIDYIIPFHRSGWGKNELQKVGVLQAYTDYQANQNERRITGQTKDGKPKYSPVKEGNFYPIDYWDYSKSGDENAATYLRMCEEDDRVPKFEQFLTKDADGHWVAPSGYWKMLIDFKMYDNDGVGAPQRAVTPQVNMDEAMRVLDEYEGGANELPVAQDIVDRFVGEIGGKSEGRVQYSLKGDDAETMHIKDQIRQNQERLNEMGPVASIRVLDDMPLRDKKQQKRWILDNLRDTGYKVDRQNFGVIEFAEKQIDTSLNYLNTPEEIAAFLAIPRVLKRGVEIHQHKDHKERGFPTVTIAAPVTINGSLGNMGIVIKKMDKNRYKTHRILMPDGSAFIYEKEKAELTPAGGAAVNGPHDQRIGSANPIIAELDTFDKGKYSLPSDDALDAEIDAWRAAHEAQMAQAENLDGESQFAQTAQKSPDAPEWWKREVRENALLKNYATDVNADQLKRATRRIAAAGYEAEVQRLLDADSFDADDTAEAGAIMNIAFGRGDVQTALDMALKYRVDGKGHATALQSRKMFAGMTPTNVKIKVAGEMEEMLSDYVESHQPRKRRVHREAEKIDEVIRGLTGGDELERMAESGEIDVSQIDNRWGVPLNEKQKHLIDHYKLNNVARPGVHYNRATTKQRMLEAILCTPDPDKPSGNGLTLTQRLEWMKEGNVAVITQADLAYIADQIAEYCTMPEEQQSERAADLALARAYEAYGNIAPAGKREKMRTWRYTSMLLSLPSAMRNVIGNSAQGLLNATADGLAVELDRLVSAFTKERTRAHLTLGERLNGWNEFAQETRNTGRDVFADKAITAHGEDRYNLNQRGRVFQNQAAETLRLIEGYLMSVGDRNFYRKKYINSLAEQYRVAEMNGVELDYEAAADQAEAEAKYATFNEDSAVRSLFTQAKKIPIFGDAIDFLMPFTGVPTNIVKRMYQYSPAGLAITAIKHGVEAAQGKNFDQRAFVDGMSRGLTGTALFAVGMALMEAGKIHLGTGEEEDEKLRDLHTAQGAQYSPYIRVGDEYVSLAALAPSISPIIMGATAYDIFKDDDVSLSALTNACLAGADQIFDASYMSALQDVFKGYGSPTQNIAKSALNSAVSQNVPSVLSQIATAMDPYVRDTKDTDYIMSALKSGLIQKIPGLREEMLNPKYDITGTPVTSKEGIRNFIDPFTTTKIVDDPVLDELERLVGTTGSSSHIPEFLIANSGRVQILAAIADEIGMDRSVGENIFNVSAEERNRYNQLYSKMCFDEIRELMMSDAYRYAGDGDKAAMISKVRKNAKLAVQKQICKDRGWNVE